LGIKSPDDPFPCLALADLYYSKNAFRKAENVLNVAIERAPYDNRVLDRHCLAMIISAEKNFTAGRFHLSWQDLEKAFQLNRQKHKTLLAAKRTIHQTVQENDSIINCLEKETSDFSSVDQLITMAFILIDLKRKKISNKTAIQSQLEKALRQKMKTISKMSSPDLVKLLSPMNQRYYSVLPFSHMASFFLTYHKTILKGIDDQRLTDVIDMILKKELYPIITKELRRRIKKKIHTR
jgi:tetratricopeptide (TPR) repeat protein